MEEDLSFLYNSDPAMMHCTSSSHGDACKGLRHFYDNSSNHVSNLMNATDLASSLQTIVQLIFFNPDLPGNMTAYLKSADASHGRVWKDGSWQSMSTYEISMSVMRRAARALYDMRNYYMYDINDVHYFRNNLYLDVFDSSPPLVRRIETIETIAQCSGIVSKYHKVV